MKQAEDMKSFKSVIGWNGRSHGAGAFTLIELLVVIAIISILAAMLMPSIAKAKGKANQIKCLNHLRQLGIATMLYADEFNGELPPRRTPTNTWDFKLKPYFSDWKIITCPSDGFSIAGMLNQYPKRSFLINGFNDFFSKTLDATNYARFKNWEYEHGMKVTDIPSPSMTIVFGEKRTDSPHVHMDFNQGKIGNDREEIEEKRHGPGSNYAFADASVRFYLRDKELNPENLWAITDELRHAPVPPATPQP